jgi:hypothetical protein
VFFNKDIAGGWDTPGFFLTGSCYTLGTSTLPPQYSR